MPLTSSRDALNPDRDLFVPSTFSRTNYFFGQLLTQSDLSAEQHYHVLAQRLAQRETFGTGTVAGLRLDAAKTERRGLLVRAGLAMDPDGRALLLDRDICVRAVEAALPSGPPIGRLVQTEPSDIVESLTERWGFATNEEEIGALAGDLAMLGLIDGSDDYERLAERLVHVASGDDFELALGRTLRDHLFNALVGTTYVGIQYAERGTDLAPAVLDASCCGNGTCYPSRTNEGVRIVLSVEPFPPVPDPFAEAFASFRERAADLGAGDAFGCHAALCDYLLSAWRALPPEPGPCGPHSPPVVPLGRVLWDRFDAPTRILDIDNCTLRPLAPGVPPVRALHEVLSGCIVATDVPPSIIGVIPGIREELPPAIRDLLPTVVMVADADLVEPEGGIVWELDLHSTDAVERWTVDEPPTELNVAARLDEDDEGRRRIICVELAPSANRSRLPAGVYHLRIEFAGEERQTESSDTALHRNSRSPSVDPSVDGTPVGTFETTFYVVGVNK